MGKERDQCHTGGVAQEPQGARNQGGTGSKAGDSEYLVMQAATGRCVLPERPSRR